MGSRDQPAVAAAPRQRPLYAFAVASPSSAPISDSRAAKAIEAISSSMAAAHQGVQKSAIFRKPSSNRPSGTPSAAQERISPRPSSESLPINRALLSYESACGKS